MADYEFKGPKGHVFEKFYPTKEHGRLKCPKMWQDGPPPPPPLQH